MGEKSLDRSAEKVHLPPASPPRNHGHTTAAWVMTIIMLVGSLVAAVGVVVTTAWLFWVGMGVVLLGAAVGRGLKMMGFGQPELPGPATADAARDDERGAR